MEEESVRDTSRLGFGEGVANCVTHRVMAFLCIYPLPTAAVYSYNESGSELAVGVSVFILCLFLVLLVSTLYHCMSFGTTYKYVSCKLNHICIYFAVTGSCTLIALTLTGGWQGYLILAIEWSVVLGGMLLKAISSKSYPKFSMATYTTVGQTTIFFLPTLLSKANSLFLVPIVGGGVVYVTGAFFYGKPQEKYFHSVWYVYINLASILHFIAIVFVMRSAECAQVLSKKSHQGYSLPAYEA